MCAAKSRDRLSAFVVIDDALVRDEVGRVLSAGNIEVHPVVDSPGCLARLSSHRVDVAIVAEPALSGRLRAASENRVPIMLLIDGGADDRVAGLEAGADDCLSRPFLGRELVARLRALARRADGDVMLGVQTRAYADVQIDRRAHRSWRGSRELGLTPTEFVLLDFLVEHAGQVVGRSRINTEVWGYDFGPSSNSLGMYVSYLRRKLERAGEPRLLHTVRGVGYVLRED